ncbi:MAG: Uma2 family endonuclease, partial [Chloroflexi bacterium]|nr:Uma2 family endonuclease [Chloroflexota bacterium]
RWTDLDGVLIPTGAELAEEQRQVAEEQRQLAEEQRQVAEKLAARLLELGIDPAEIQ